MKIELSKYEGYLWYSDSPKPIVLDGTDFELQIDESECPFIVEGQLFDGSRSVSIRYVDGRYRVTEFTVSAEEIAQSQCFMSNKMDGRKLLFVRRWRPYADPNCEGMETRIPGEMVFVGFEK